MAAFLQTVYESKEEDEDYQKMSLVKTIKKIKIKIE